MTPYTIGHITIETGNVNWLTVKDDLTDQSIALTRDELRDLRLVLNTMEEDGI